MTPPLQCGELASRWSTDLHEGAIVGTASVETASLGDALVAYERWRTILAGFSPKTWAGEKSGLLAFVDLMVHYGVTQVHQVSRGDVEAWWIWLDLQDSTKATRLSQLRSFLRFCVENDWLSHDPSSLLRAAKPVPVHRERLAPNELLELLQAAGDPRDRVLLALCMNLGLRASEIKRLTLRDVDLVNGTILVRVEKTREAPDPMPVTADLSDEVSIWVTHYGATTPDITLDSYLVPSRYVINSGATKGAVLYRHTKPVGDPEDVVHAALAAVGWDDSTGEGVHTIRRSVARVYFDMIEESESFDSALLATMTLLHHTKPETTITYIGRNRLTLARDRVLKGQPFLTRLATPTPSLRAVR